MLNDLIAHIAKTNGLVDSTAKQALGIILNAAERQGSPAAPVMFRTVPGARTLAARTGSEIGAPVGEIARLIEQTPGGRRLVAVEMLASLHRIGLDHVAIGNLLPTIGTWMERTQGVEGFGHLGDLIAHDPAKGDTAAARAA